MTGLEIVRGSGAFYRKGHNCCWLSVKNGIKESAATATLNNDEMFC